MRAPATSSYVEVPPEPLPEELADNQLSCEPVPERALRATPSFNPLPKGGEGFGAGLSRGEAPMYPALGTDTFNNSIYRRENTTLDSARQRCAQQHAPQQRSEYELKFSIPGADGKPDPNCGTVIKWVACSHDPKHHKSPKVDHCDRIECPTCWTFWANKQAKRMADRLRGYVESAGKMPYAWHKINAQNLRHWVFSPPEGAINPEADYDSIKTLGKTFIQSAGCTGGVFVFHPWRIKEEYQLELIKATKAMKLSIEEKEKKFWQAAREDVLGLGSWREYCYWSPHFHVTGFGYVVNARELHAKTGWVYKLIRNVRVARVHKPEGIDDQVAGLLFYQISHAAYQWQKKIPVWFGCCTPRNLKKDGDPVPSEFDGMKLVCPKCQSYIVEYHDNEGEPGLKKIADDYDPNDKQEHWDDTHGEIIARIHDKIQKYVILKEFWICKVKKLQLSESTQSD